MANKKGLGKGFDILVPVNVDVDEVVAGTHEKVHKLAIDIVVPKKEQPRQNFDEIALQELTESIKQHGIIQPLIVNKIEQNLYSIIAGERRWRAAQLAGLQEIPAIVRTANEHEQLEIALLENIQRTDLTAIELAAAIQKLHTQFNQDYEHIAKRLGKAHKTVVNIIRLLGLPSDIQAALQAGKITEGHARSILALQKFPKEQQQLFKLVINKGITVRQAEQFVVAVKQQKTTTNKKTAPKAISDESTKNITKYLGAKEVQIYKSMKGSGKIIIYYDSENHLEKIIDKMLKR